MVGDRPETHTYYFAVFNGLAFKGFLGRTSSKVTSNTLPLWHVTKELTVSLSIKVWGLLSFSSLNPMFKILLKFPKEIGA